MKQISSKVFQISLGSVNVFVVEDDGLTLVDTGMKGSADKIFSAIKKAGRNPENIQRIILTHVHPDHSGSAAEIKRRLNIPVWAHGIDAELMEQGVGVRGATHLSPGIVNWLIFNLFIKRSDSAIEPVIVEKQLTDNEVLPIAGGTRILHTPGHSAGHVALLIEKEKVLISGDICANLFGLAISTVYEDIKLGIKSIGKVTNFMFDKAVFGHGNSLEKDADQKLKDFYNKLNSQ
ncbi:MBL fold metallo-hydrolase [Dyadobacter subterraneus]|uniref:MBL fold metallo-hydrolase n=1 Tax=Dyadobacter subterraneus TaxID=2773304 RepID=A0ABR9W8D7_9BACT|nr:MBL fold metallo-hydrolase [Dyadobacter subterraneus]MBE9461728.1 MBL fold metallo-hydrolase [Dyadobacter subterraneus]